MRPVILFVVNDLDFFISHRLPIALAAISAGYDIHLAARSTRGLEKLNDLNIKYHELRISRSGKNAFGELLTFFSILRLCFCIKPNILHLVTIKPVIYGGIISLFAPVKGVVAAISGLGTVFLAEGKKASLFRWGVMFLYKISLSNKNIRVIFQNPDDLRLMLNKKLISYNASVLISGSGVNLKDYVYEQECESIPVVTMAARLLKDKGVMEFVEAVYLLVSRGVKAKFQLVGEVDLDNSTSISASQLESWRNERVIECAGFQSDISGVFTKSHIVVLPSYREGLPKVLVEAAACGRAVITTDVPGCRDAILPNESGLLVPARDSSALADAIQILLENPQLRQQMGRAGRLLAEQKFSIEYIVQQHLDIYKVLEGASESR